MKLPACSAVTSAPTAAGVQCGGSDRCASGVAARAGLVAASLAAAGCLSWPPPHGLRWHWQWREWRAGHSRAGAAAPAPVGADPLLQGWQRSPAAAVAGVAAAAPPAAAAHTAARRCRTAGAAVGVPAVIQTAGQRTQPAGAAEAAEKQASCRARYQAPRRAGQSGRGLWGAERRRQAGRDILAGCQGFEVGGACKRGLVGHSWVLREKGWEIEVSARPPGSAPAAGTSLSAAAAAAATLDSAGAAPALPVALGQVVCIRRQAHQQICCLEQLLVRQPGRQLARTPACLQCSKGVRASRITGCMSQLTHGPRA